MKREEATARFRDRDEDVSDLLRSMKEDFGVTEEGLAEILRVSPRSVKRWIHRDAKPQPDFLCVIERVALLRDQMLKTLKKEAIPKYLQARNQALGRMRPVELLATGKIARVEADLASLEAGVF